MTLHERFSKNVKARTHALGITTAKLAEMMGVTPQYVNTYINMHSSPGLGVLAKFADALGCDPSDLLLPIPVTEHQLAG